MQKEHFVAWRRMVHDKVETGQASAFWANKRTRAVKAAFRRAMKDYTLPINKGQVDELLFPLYQMPEPTSDDQPFSPEDVRLLLEGARSQIKAMILLALNGCLDNIDVSRVEWQHIDLKRKQVTYPRRKPGWRTARPRRFRLWERTVAAFRGRHDPVDNSVRSGPAVRHDGGLVGRVERGR